MCIFHNIIYTSYQQNSDRVLRVEFCEKFQKLNFGDFFIFAPFTLSCVHVTWMLKVDSSSVTLWQQFLIFHVDTSRWFNKHTFRVWSQLQSCIFGIFSMVPFHLVFVVTSEIKLIPLYCSHFEWPEIRHADVSWPPWQLIRFWSSSVDFSSFGRHFDLVKQAKFAISGHFLESTREEWPQIWHVDVFWPPSEQIRFWSRYVDIPHFGTILTQWNRSNLGVPGFSIEWMGGMA